MNDSVSREEFKAWRKSPVGEYFFAMIQAKKEKLEELLRLIDGNEKPMSEIGAEFCVLMGRIRDHEDLLSYQYRHEDFGVKGKEEEER